METLWTLDTRHILDPYALRFRYRLTFTTADGNKRFFVFSGGFTFSQIQFIEGITVALKQLCFFDGDIFGRAIYGAEY